MLIQQYLQFLLFQEEEAPVHSEEEAFLVDLIAVAEVEDLTVDIDEEDMVLEEDMVMADTGDMVIEDDITVDTDMAHILDVVDGL